MGEGGGSSQMNVEGIFFIPHHSWITEKFNQSLQGN